METEKITVNDLFGIDLERAANLAADLFYLYRDEKTDRFTDSAAFFKKAKEFCDKLKENEKCYSYFMLGKLIGKMDILDEIAK